MTKTKLDKRSVRLRKKLWGPFLKFYTKFRIPWWMFILSALGSILYAEVELSWLSEVNIAIKTGELYNSTIFGYIGATLCMSLLTVVYNMLSSYGSGITTLRVRTHVWKKLVYFPSAAFDKEQPSSFVSRITADAAQASTLITYLCLFASSVYAIVRAYMYFIQLNLTLGLVMFSVIPIAILNFWIVGRTQYFAYKKIYGAINKMTAFFSEHLSTMKHCKAQCMEEEEIKAGYAAIEERFKADVFNALMSALQVTSNSIYTKISFFILVLTGKQLIEQGQEISIAEGDTRLNSVQKYLAEILTQYQQLKAVQAVTGRIVEISDAEVEQPKALAPMPEEQRDIVFDHVSFGYNEDTEVLHDLCVTIPAGKKTAIVGNNGCGKSTLFKLLMRFYEPTEGTIRYGEENISDIHKDEWRRSFGYVLQNSPLLAGSIRDNITYGCRGEVTQEEIENAAKIANAYDFITEFEEGFDKDVGEGGARLSGGQRQRVAIARAVIVNPEILLMDEATASLDYQSDKLIWEATRRLMEGRTTVLIAHDMSAVLSADNIIVLNEGRVEAQGTREEVWETSPTYREYVRLQTVKAGGAA